MKFHICTAVIGWALFFTGCATGEHHQESEAPEKTVHTRNFTAVKLLADSLSATIPAKLGVAVLDLGSGDSMSHNGREAFVMYSTYKFPLALYALKQVEAGKLSLDQEVPLTAERLKAYPRGKFVETHTKQGQTVRVDSLIWYAMLYSDNITTDALFDLVGGPAAVQEFIRGLGIQGISISHTVLEMGQQHRYRDNWVHPVEMNRLLALFASGKVVNQRHTELLNGFMEAAPSGANRLPGALPQGTLVAHKTGTGGTEAGVLAAVNDIGIIRMPDGSKIAVSVYLNDISLGMEEAEAVIALIARSIYDVALQ